MISSLYKYEQGSSISSKVKDEATTKDLEKAKAAKAKELGGGPCGELRAECLYEGA